LILALSYRRLTWAVLSRSRCRQSRSRRWSWWLCLPARCLRGVLGVGWTDCPAAQGHVRQL